MPRSPLLVISPVLRTLVPLLRQARTTCCSVFMHGVGRRRCRTETHG
ncbi:n/a [Ectocarpus siliculosus]|uniref:N/a n=1 Tax=Ectocarpus siliculosus TaxID=2880 RepID=D7G5W5_ECTSI|nr:n/a [Ectocarpus siliculosus]|eukprot:CBJ27403.1 n/a [Ectocarpus siliculosus]